jgi:hypothetical protein
MPSYTEVAISSYNAATAPSDDGTVTATNLISWAILKTKLSDPLNTAIAAIDTNIAAAISTITSNLSTSNTTLTSVNASYATATGALYAPAATGMIFQQTAAPTGWTKGATHNNKALRLVSGAVSSGGSTAFTSVLTSITLATANLPAHTHSWSDTATLDFSSTTTFRTDVSLHSSTGVTGGGANDRLTDFNESTDTMSATVSVSGTTDSAGSGTAMDFAVKYIDVIFATKD